MSKTNFVEQNEKIIKPSNFPSIVVNSKMISLFRKITILNLPERPTFNPKAENEIWTIL